MTGGYMVYVTNKAIRGLLVRSAQFSGKTTTLEEQLQACDGFNTIAHVCLLTCALVCFLYLTGDGLDSLGE